MTKLNLITFLFVLLAVQARAAVFQNWATTNANPVPIIGQGGTGQTTARAASSALSVQMISAIGGGSTLDYATATPAFQGQFGITYSGNLEPNIFYGSATGVGTNGWARTPISIINPLDSVGALGFGPGGNWADFPAEAIGNNTVFFQNWGPAAAGVTNAPPQPQFRVVNGNPRSGTAQVSVAVAMTNSTWGGNLQGQDSLGRNIYVDQFGFSLYNNSDDVKPITNNESQQPATWGLLGNSPKEILFLTQNASRPGDLVNGGQVGGMYIDWTAAQASGDIVWSLPVQVSNVWMPTNAAWQNLIVAHEGPAVRAVLMTNATMIVSNLESGLVPASVAPGGYFFNAGHVWLFRNNSGDDTSARFTVNTNGSFNSDDAAWTFDSTQAERLGFVKQHAAFPGLYAATGAPLNLGHSSASALVTGVFGSTLTNELFLDSGGSVNVLRNANIAGSLTMGASTNIASFTLVNTNFGNGQLYTNLTGRPIMVSANATLTTAGVSGNAALDLRISGSVTNHVGLSTIVTSIAASYTNSITGFVPAGATYVFTNVSSGAGDSAGVNGGQYMVY